MSTFLFAILWNAGVASGLALVVALASRMKFFRLRPVIVHTLWLLVLAKLVVPPLVEVPLLDAGAEGEAVAHAPRKSGGGTIGEPWPLPSERHVLEASAATSASLGVAVRRANASASVPWALALIGISASGTLVLVAGGLAQYVRVSRLLRLATRGDERLTALAHAAAAGMGVRVRPTVSTVDAPIAPLLWPHRNRPWIVLPLRLVQEMDDAQLACILCHELAHFVRRDHWSNLFALAVNAHFWWHPVAWWARREMRAAQEVCCDGLALAAGGLSRRCYAETLLKALDFVQSDQTLQPALASGFGGSSSLRRRFEMIATLDVGHRFSLVSAALAALGVAGMFCLPVRAQPKPAQAWVETASIQNAHPVNIVACNLNWVALGDEAGNVVAWDAKMLKERKLLMKGVRSGGSNHSVDRLQFTPDGRNLYAVLDNYHAMWQLHLTDDFERPSPGVAGDDPHFFGFSSDAEIWLERHVDKTHLALRHNPWTPGARADFEGIQYSAEILHAVLSEDGKRLAVVAADEKLHVHDRESLAELHTISLANQSVLAIALSRDGKKVAVVGERSFAKVFDTDSGKEIAALQGHQGIVYAVAFSPDGNTLVTGGIDDTARVWEAATGRSVAVLEGHKDDVRSVAFHPDGDVLITGSTDKTVKIWKRR